MKRRSLYLIRHAETAQSGRFLGRTDAPLSSRGWRQARALGRRLARVRLDAVFCSHLRRSQETAECLTPTRPPIPLQSLEERDFGEWENLSWAEIERDHPAQAEAYCRYWPEWDPPGAESLADMKTRVSRAWETIRQASWRKAAVVGHAGTNAVLLSLLLGSSCENLLMEPAPYTGIRRIEIGQENRLLSADWEIGDSPL